MATWFKLLLALFIGLVAFKFRVTSARSNSSESDDNDDHEKEENLTIAWIYKPPYIRGPDNSSLDNQAHGIVRDATLRHIQWDCSGFSGNPHYKIKTLKVDSESHMIQLLKQNKVHLAIPIFEQQDNQKYSEFIFFKLLDYPGTEYITLADDENNDALDVVFDSVLKSWPLLAVTMIFTAIAGIIMWALVRIRSTTAVLQDKFECMVATSKCSHISIYPNKSVSVKKLQGFFRLTKMKADAADKALLVDPKSYFKQP